MTRATFIALGLMAVGLAGCSETPASVEFSHVHGIGYLPDDNRILVATHHGLITGALVKGAWSWTYAGDERYDYMGFTQDGVNPGTLYSSGHPDDPREFGAVHLGVRRSTDGGATWEQRSLKGQVDFHSLNAIPGVEGGLLGLWRDTIMESRDGGLTWINHTGPSMLMFDLAVTDHHVYVATADGLMAGHAGNHTSWQSLALPEGRAIHRIAASPDGSTLLAGTGTGRAGGSTYISTDGGMNWTRSAHELLADAPVPLEFAFDPVDPRHVLAGTAGGSILESRDGAVTWAVLRRA